MAHLRGEAEHADEQEHRKPLWPRQKYHGDAQREHPGGRVSTRESYHSAGGARTHPIVVRMTHCVEYQTRLCSGCARLPIARMIVSAWSTRLVSMVAARPQGTLLTGSGGT